MEPDATATAAQFWCCTHIICVLSQKKNDISIANLNILAGVIKIYNTLCWYSGKDTGLSPGKPQFNSRHYQGFLQKDLP